MNWRAVPPALLLFALVFSPALADSAGSRPPSKPGVLYNHHVTVDRYLGARDRSDRPPAIPNADPAAASPRFLVPGGNPNGRGVSASSSPPSARGRESNGWFPIGTPLGIKSRDLWPLGLTPYDRRTRRDLAGVIRALD
jgi:hypothetical protein